jgi:hypothetical protein
MYAALVENRQDFGNEWQGWRMRGAYLISPDGDRVSARRLRGLLFAASLTKPRRAQVAKVEQAPVVPSNVLKLPVRRVA